MAQRRPRENVLDIEKYIEKRVRVKFTGGREVIGVLKGFDPLMNLVLDECIEFLRDPADPLRTTAESRALGLIVCRGPQVTVVIPADEMTEIPNPFVGGADEDVAGAQSGDAAMAGT